MIDRPLPPILDDAGGALILGLGCESVQLDALLAAAPDIDPARLRAFPGPVRPRTRSRRDWRRSKPWSP